MSIVDDMLEAFEREEQFRQKRRIQQALHPVIWLTGDMIEFLGADLWARGFNRHKDGCAEMVQRDGGRQCTCGYVKEIPLFPE